jgi:hypothetical protein
MAPDEWLDNGKGGCTRYVVGGSFHPLALQLDELLMNCLGKLRNVWDSLVMPMIALYMIT